MVKMASLDTANLVKKSKGTKHLYCMNGITLVH